MLDFCLAAEQNDYPAFGETVNVTPLITASAALAHYHNSDDSERSDIRSENVKQLTQELSNSPWSPLKVDERMRSGAILLRSRSESLRELSASKLRYQFHRRRVCLSAYASGLVRVSVPERIFRPQELQLIKRAFAA